MLVRGVTDVSGFCEILGAERTWRIISNTVLLALGGTIGSVLLGVPGAYILYRTRFPGRAILRNIAVIPFVLPTVVVGVAFRSLLAPGAPLGFLGLDKSHTAVILAMVFFNFSVIIRQVGALWVQLDPQATEAARVLGASRARAFFTVTLPALTPAIASSAGLVFLFCSTAYGLIRSLGTPGAGTLETEVFRQTQTFLDLNAAAVFSLLQLVIVVASVILTQRINRRATTGLTMTQEHQVPLTRGDALPFVVTIVTVLGLILWPLGSLVIRSLRYDGEFSLHNYRLLSSFSGDGYAGGATVLQALEHSVKIAADATLITVVMAVPLAILLTRRPPNQAMGLVQRGLDGLVMLPIGVSSVTVGFGFIISLQLAVPQLAQSGALVALAQAVVALPLVVRTLTPILASISPGLREAASTLGASPTRILVTVDGPFLVRGIGLSVGFAFAVSLGEFGATSFLASPDYQTLPVLIVRLLSRPGADNFGVALAAAVILGLLSALVLLVCERLRPPSVSTQGARV